MSPLKGVELTETGIIGHARVPRLHLLQSSPEKMPMGLFDSLQYSQRDNTDWGAVTEVLRRQAHGAPLPTIQPDAGSQLRANATYENDMMCLRLKQAKNGVEQTRAVQRYKTDMLADIAKVERRFRTRVPVAGTWPTLPEAAKTCSVQIRR